VFRKAGFKSHSSFVMPAEAGIQRFNWTQASAGVTTQNWASASHVHVVQAPIGSFSPWLDSDEM
jgi:hypothetical protein